MPVTGEFIYRHTKALSEYCNVHVIVPLRFLPPRELFSANVFKSFANLFTWFKKIIGTRDYEEEKLKIVYFRYFSLPKLYFELSERRFVKFFYYNRLKKIMDGVNPDILYCNWIRPWADLCAVYASERKIPFIIDHHEDIPTLKKLFPGNYKSFLNVFDKADKVIVHSTINKTELFSEKQNLKEIEIIYLGQNFIVSDKEKDFNFEKIRLICISHLNERRKNINILLQAVKVLKGKANVELLITGDGILRRDYEKLADELSVKTIVNFTGSKLQNELKLMYENADIFVLPSYPEAFGIVFIEALANGLPVITCKGNGGGEELKLLGYPAVLINPGSVEELAESILSLLNDREKMSEMSSSGKKIVRDYFTWEKNALSTYKLLSETISDYGK